METVLVIDDEPCVREVVHALLESEFHVVEAASGPEGVTLAAQATPQVILLDYLLPGMDGPATMARLHDDPRTCDIPVVMMSGLGEELAERKLHVAGLVKKPFRRADLLAELHRAAHRPAQAETRSEEKHLIAV